MLVDVDFQPSRYGTETGRILLLNDPEAARVEIGRLKARDLFPGALSPEGAVAGLYLHFSLIDDAHKIAQDLSTPEGSFWHGIVHRREPDAANAAYWFRKVGRHAIFPALRDEAHRMRFDTGREWNPFEFIDFW